MIKENCKNLKEKLVRSPAGKDFGDYKGKDVRCTLLITTYYKFQINDQLD